MAGIRFCMLKSLAGSVRATEHFNVRPIFAILGHNYHTDTSTKSFNFNPRASPQICKSSAFSSALLNPRAVVNFPLVRMTPMLSYHPYSSFASGGGKGGDEGVGVPEASGSGEVDVSSGGIDVNEWVDKLKDGWKSAVDGVTVAVEKVKETSSELTPQVQQVLDCHPYLNDVVVPVGGTVTAAMLAWLVMPRILKRLHGYTRGSAVLLSRSVLAGEVPYEKSVWAALEDPVRYLVTFMAFSQVCCLVAPNALACQFVAQAWKGAVVLSSVWFLHRWKTNLFARALAAPNVNMIDRDKLLTLDKVSSVGLFAVGVMALAEACGVAVHSILTVGGIGGVATAFAARDILGNVLSGMSMQFSKPFSLGDTIKAGSIEGQVVHMGLTTTSLLNAEKFPVIVPNSMFSSQVIVNKSRAEWRAFMSTIPLQLDSVENVPQISDKIKEMLRSYPKAFLGREAPYCYLSRIETSYAEITLGCNLKHMSKEERYSTEQDILLQSIQIIKQHGASLGSSQQDFITK